LIYCNTRKEAIEARKQLRQKGLDATFRKAKRWLGYNVWGDNYCFVRPRKLTVNPKSAEVSV